MGKLYEKIDEEEMLCKDILLPERFPAIYIDEHDEVYCYDGIIDNDRFLLGSYPYWLKNRKPSEAQKHLRGYFRIQNGLILKDKKFIDESHSLSGQAKCKRIPAYIQLPTTTNIPYSVHYDKNEDVQNELSRKIFGLCYKDLSELLFHYNKFFGIIPDSYYNIYPSITRSIKSDNYCDITNMWIPANFPYIAFQESGYYYSHISLYGFYQHVKFMTQNYIGSPISKELIANGLNIEILEHLFDMETHSFNSMPIDYYRFIELNELE